MLNRVAAHMGYDRLGDAYRRFMWVYLSMTSAGMIAGAYFSVFLLRATGSDMALMYYNLLLALVQPFVMGIAVFTLRRFSVISSQRIGFVLLLFAYVLLTFRIDRIESVVYPVSVLMSSGNAFFFTSYTPMMLRYTTDENRDAASGALSFLATLLSLIIPVATGFFISSFGDLRGYRVLFALSSLLCALTIGLSFRLAPVPGFGRERRAQFRTTLRGMRSSRLMMMAMLNTMLNAVITTAPAYFGTLIVMDLIGRESLIGLVAFLGGIISMVASAMYGRMVAPGNRAKWMAIGVGVILTAIGGMIAKLSVATFVLYSAAAAFATIFIGTPPVTSYLSVLQRNPALRENGPEVHTIREIFYGGGRALGLVPVFFFRDAREIAVYMILAVYAVQALSVLLTWRIGKNIET